MIVVSIVGVTTAAAAVVVTGRMGSFFQTRQQGLGSPGDADESEQCAVDAFGRGTHLDDDVVNAQRDVKFRAVFKVALQHNTLIAQCQHCVNR